MFPQKKDQSFASTPVSRVGLSILLNQLAGNANVTSRPGTPGASYITSSLNPTKNLPITQSDFNTKFKTAQELEKYNLLAITQSLRQFESTFSELSQSISSFQEDSIVQHVKGLIDICDSMTNEIKVLEKHLKLDREVDYLLVTRSALDKHTKHLLKDLIACRAELKKLPKLSAAGNTASPANDVNAISVPEVIDYSMKLAKFSKAPATVVSQLIHPNNYIWPAEDALRRGMLAMASLKGGELIKAELGDFEEEVGTEDVLMEDAIPSPEDIKIAGPSEKSALGEAETLKFEPVQDHKVERKPGSSKEEVAASSALNLDLFDPDEDSDSD